MKNLILTISILTLCGCSSASGFTFAGQNQSSLNTSYHVNASWYESGRKTANGEKFNPDGMTAAHRKLPFNTKVKVTNPVNGNSIIVRIHDRGPFIKGRELDLARGAAKAIGMKHTSKVLMQVLND